MSSINRKYITPQTFEKVENVILFDFYNYNDCSRRS